MTETEAEKLKKQRYYEDPSEEDDIETCPDGYSADDDCCVEGRAGNEYCEFLCPFHRVQKYWKEDE